MKPATGTPILRPSVEATPARDLCTFDAAAIAARHRILIWLANGAREVSWALGWLPRERWVAPPPAGLSDWPALRHARHLAVHETRLVLPRVLHALGEAVDAPPSTTEITQEDAAWDATAALQSAEAIVRSLAETRFALLQCLEAAPDEAWERPLPSTIPSDPSPVADPVQLDWWLLSARQHELEHLAAIWRVALNWERVSSHPGARGTHQDPAAGLARYPADRLEESH